MATYDFSQLRNDMVNGARATFSLWREQNPNDQFYAFALYTDDSAEGATPAANSQQSLERCLHRYQSRSRQLAVRQMPFVRFCPDEWMYHGGVASDWEAIWERNATLGDVDDDSFRTYKDQMLETMILTLQDLDTQRFFGVGAERESVTLMVWITDSSEAVKWWVRSIRRLNPEKVFERFWTVLPEETRFVAQMDDLSDAQKRHVADQLAASLCVVDREIEQNDSISNKQTIRDTLARLAAKLRMHSWREEDFGHLIPYHIHSISGDASINRVRSQLYHAAKECYKIAAGRDLE